MHVYVGMHTYMCVHNSYWIRRTGGMQTCKSAITLPVFGKYRLREETVRSYWPCLQKEGEHIK